MGDSPRARVSRETRMLLMIITLSVVVLIVLSRFRFPDEPAPGKSGATPLPLERLAARATYDELATIIADLDRRVSPLVSVLRIDTNGAQHFLPALRVRPDLLLAHVSGESRILAFVNSDAPVDIAGFDPVRSLVLLRVAPEPARVAVLDSRPQSPQPRYVAAVEGTPGGAALRPLFLGRTDRLPDPRYPDGQLVLGGVLLASPGSIIFGLDGTFVALCVTDRGYAAGITGDALNAAVDGMLRPPAQ